MSKEKLSVTELEKKEKIERICKRKKTFENK